MDSGASGKTTHSAVIPALVARLIEERMSWNFLPLNTRDPSGSTVSSATCRLGQPRLSVTAFTSAVVLYRHGVHPCVLHQSTNSRTVASNSSRGPTGSPVV